MYKAVEKRVTKINIFITKTCLFKYIENFTTKNWKFSDKNSYIFHISAQNKYPQSMFLLAEIRKIMYTPVKLNFTI